eukprot:2636-Heterococcus_DN1.PRE.1
MLCDLVAAGMRTEAASAPSSKKRKAPKAAKGKKAKLSSADKTAKGAEVCFVRCAAIVPILHSTKAVQAHAIASSVAAAAGKMAGAREKAAEERHSFKQPAMLTGGQLKPYQLDGVQWLASLFSQ